MGPRATVCNAAGLLALAASLALASPGVNVVRSEPERRVEDSAAAPADTRPAPVAEEMAQPGAGRRLVELRREPKRP
jgi:hypothetical protein